MPEDIFSIENFNVYSDAENYYFFRALNMADNRDIETGITTDSNGKILKIRTNLERYEDIPMYSKDDEVTLEEMFNHIKIHQRKDTNCISLSSNANASITYGRGSYKDTYAIVKVPKTEMNKKVFEAGSYMVKEINKRIAEKIINGELTEEKINILRRIEQIENKEELKRLKEEITTPEKNNDEEFEGGLEKEIITSSNYLSLNEKQNLEKDKIVLKLSVLDDNIVKGASNTFLIQTLGSAFSSSELIHYKEIDGSSVIKAPKEYMDLLGIVQQVPKDIPNIEQLMQELIKKADKIKLVGEYNFEKHKIDDYDLSMDKMYELTEGKLSYGKTMSLYQKAFFYAKSKMRMMYAYNLLAKIIPDINKYEEVFKYIRNNCFGIEPEIINRVSTNSIAISESVGLNFSVQEIDFYEYLKNLKCSELNTILQNPNETIKNLVNKYVDESIDMNSQDKLDWYANSLIDMLDLSRFNLKPNLSLTQRNDVIDILKENDFYNKYFYYRNIGKSNKNIADIIFTSIIRGIDEVDENDLFTLEELEDFIGYNKVKGTGLKLKSYQRSAVNNIDKIFETRRFTSAIMPTGTGKSFIALDEMYKKRNEPMLYLAPNVEILNQMFKYIRTVFRPEEHIMDGEKDVVKRLFPNTIFDTYQHLKEKSANEIINNKYSLIIFDELHRTGANEWKKYVKTLLDNQDDKTKVLGITATPERDMDLKDMTDQWAQYYGYSDEEIISGKHIAYNMDLSDAITLGYVTNPKIINCEYSLISDGTMEEIKYSIDDLKNEKIKGEKLKKYEEFRRNIEHSDGIEKILGNNLKQDGKYIIFLPVSRKDDNTYEDEDGNKISKSTAERIIKSYQAFMKQLLFSYEYFNQHGVILETIYNKINNKEELTKEELGFLYNEKDEILLLSKLNIVNKPMALNTQNDIVIENIIDHMKWEKLDEFSITKKLNKKMNSKIDDYSMLGSYSNEKNKRNLDEFSKNKTNKIKFMFVMNKLNEGVHCPCDGIIWLRPLTETSRILFLQQLGRIIHPKEKDQSQPVVFDLVNNCVRVRLDKGIPQEEIDLDKLLLIKDWIKINDKIPNINSYDEIESNYAKRLNAINYKYRKYYKDKSLLSELNVKTRILITEIIANGTDIDLWNMPFNEREQRNNQKDRYQDDNLLNQLYVKEVIRDLVELEDETIGEKTPQEWVKEVEKYCEEYQEWPSAFSSSQKSVILYRWLTKSKYISKDFKYKDQRDENGELLIEILDNLKSKYSKNLIKTPQEWVKELQVYCEKYQEWPILDGANENSSSLYRWLAITAKYISGNFRYKDMTDENGVPLIEILDDIKSRMDKNKETGEKHRIRIKVKEIQDYCEEYQEWPSGKSNNPHSKNLYTWLRYSNYISGNFKYKDITDENGILLIDILNGLQKKYNNRKAPQEWVKEIQEYCEKYQEWPSISSSNENSKSLYSWLSSTSKYISGNFIYKDITDENGVPLIETLDNLKLKYLNRSRIKKSPQKTPQEWVKEIQKYCEKYQEWPSLFSSNENSKSLYNWLNGPSKYTSRNFVYNDIRDENGVPLIETLDNLKLNMDKIKEEKEVHEDIEKARQKVKEIQEYCEKYQEWPSGKSTNSHSKSLYTWLNNKSKYTSGNFKYKDIRDENGILLIKILDNLKSKYSEMQMRSPQERVKELQAYCEKYQKWPNLDSENEQSSSLYRWLTNTSKYTSGNFKYKDVKDENGVLLKEILDNLNEKYGKNLVRTPQEWVKEVEKYCEEYQEWPRRSSSNEKSKKLYEWLCGTSKYMSGNFKYKDIRDENGVPLIEMLDNLKEKYGKNLMRTPQEWVKELQLYCEEYQEWPSISSSNESSKRLYSWLSSTSKYTNGKFIYKNLIDENGVPLIKIIDKLKEKYSENKIKSPQEWVKEVKKYCEEYQEWPSERISKENSNSLYRWLSSTSKYTSGNFKYKDIRDENGVLLIETLDNLKTKMDKIKEEKERKKDLETIVNKVREIQEYCEKYQEWPSDSGPTPQSRSLYTWLCSTSRYISGNFVYKDIRDENGVLLIDILDDIKTKMDKIKEEKEVQENIEKARIKVKEVQEYCNKYQEWPNQYSSSLQSRSLNTWLKRSKYTSGNFAYKDIRDENGILLINILRELELKYRKLSKEKYNVILEEYKNDSIFEKTKNIKENNNGRKV